MTFYERIGFKPRKLQAHIRKSQARFNVIVCHRRFGKTLWCCADALEKLDNETLPNPRAAYFCATKVQAKRVSWDYFKQLSEPLQGDPNEVELKIDLPEGRRLNLGTAERADHNRGIYLDHTVIDEPALMPTRLWSEILRPALVDREGTATFIGTPAGRHGLLWTLCRLAENDPDWRLFLYRASETKIVNAKELAAAAKVMTKDEYAQEFECSFSAAIKGAYIGKTINSVEDKGRICELDVIPELPVHIGLDSGERQENNSWFFQVLDNGRIHVLEHEHYPLMSIADIASEWKKKPYAHLGKVILNRARSNADYMSVRGQTLRRLGFNVVEPFFESVFVDMIETTRNVIARMLFDADQCFHGLEALRQFRADWDERKECFSTLPVKDWSYENSAAFMNICNTIEKIRLSPAQDPDYTELDKSRAWA